MAMTRFVRSFGTAAILLALATVAGAQQSPPTEQSQPAEPRSGEEFGVRAPAPQPRPEIRLEPTRPPDEAGGRAQKSDPVLLPGSQHGPALLAPVVADVQISRTAKARIGLSGWTAPAIPYDSKDGAGGPAFGLTIMWGIPVNTAATSEPESAPTGER